jgi:hypothetical protein
MILTGKQKNVKKGVSQCNFSTTNQTWIDPGANPGLLGDSPATNRLSHVTVKVWVFVDVFKIISEEN